MGIYKLSIVFTLLCELFLCFGSDFHQTATLTTKTVNPGLLVRITKSTFDYATDIAIRMAENQVRHINIPDQSGEESHIKYKISELKIKKFDIKSKSVGLLPNQGVSYRFADIDFAITGTVHVKAFSFLKMHASFEIESSGISVGMVLRIGLNSETGRPTVNAGDCQANVPYPKVIIRHGTWILKYFSKALGKIIRRAIQERICSGSTMNEINSQIQNLLKQLPTSENFLNDFTLDVRMLQKPVINQTLIDSQHKGEVFWYKNHKECPLPVRPMEPMPMSTTKNMVSLQLSTYTLNSLAYVAYHNKYIHYIFDSKNIPKAGLLNTTCQNICIGKLIPQLAKAYPNKEVSILLEGTDMPEPNIDRGYLTLDGTISLTIYLSTATPDQPLLIIPIKIHTISTANIVDQIVHYNISVLKLKLGLVKKGLPIKIDIEQLQHTINFGINAFLMPKINERGHQGFPVPQNIKNVKLTSTKFFLGLNSAIFSTDFRVSNNFGSDNKFSNWFESFLQIIGRPANKILSSIGRLNVTNFKASA